MSAEGMISCATARSGISANASDAPLSRGCALRRQPGQRCHPGRTKPGRGQRHSHLLQKQREQAWAGWQAGLGEEGVAFLPLAAWPLPGG